MGIEILKPTKSRRKVRKTFKEKLEESKLAKKLEKKRK